MNSNVSIFGDWLVLDIPRYFTIFGLNIYYYAIIIVLGFTLATVYLVKRQKLFGLTTDNILDMLLIAVPCGIIGARIYYMLFNFNDFFGPGQWGNIIRFRDGGLAVYGGIIASAIGFIIYSRVKKIPLGNMLDAAGFGLFIGQAIGRWGNFINAEAYGVETNLPWKMGITTWGRTTYHHPTFLYESLWNLGGFLIIHAFSKRFKSKYPGQYFLFYVAWYGLGRFMIEGLRTDSLFIPGTELRVSQWLAALSMLAAVAILINNHVSGKGAKSFCLEEASENNESSDSDDTENNEDAELAKLDGAEQKDVDLASSDETDDAGDSESDGEDIDELAELDGVEENDINDNEMEDD